jgi:hypothetical protein
VNALLSGPQASLAEVMRHVMPSVRVGEAVWVAVR